MSPLGAEAELRLDCLDDDQFLFRDELMWRARLSRAGFSALRVQPAGGPRPLRFVARLIVAGATRFAAASRAVAGPSHVTLELGTAPLADADDDGVPDDVDNCAHLWDPSGACPTGARSTPPRGVRRAPADEGPPSE